MSTREKLIIKGGTPLKGSVTISGAKNAAVALVAAAVLVEGEVVLENVPDISDVRVMLDVIVELGGSVEKLDESTVVIDATNITKTKTKFGPLSTTRCSYYYIGALLGRFKKAEVTFPGGCNFQRPIDQHIKGFEALGAEIDVSGGYISAKTKQLVGAQIYFDKATVGATINTILAAVLAKGTTIIENAASEPHVVDVANFLNMMGAQIRGAGTNEIRIKGVEKLTGGKTYTVVHDMIEAGTFMIAGAATKGQVTVKNVIPEHMEALTAKLREIGVEVIENDDSIEVRGTNKPKGVNITTMPHPGFATDLHPQIVAYLASLDGKQSTLTEAIYDTRRFQYIAQLVQLKADITIQGYTAIINGTKDLAGAPVISCDLRAAVALIIAGLISKGETHVYNLEFLDRGYEDFVSKMEQLGAKIERVKDED